MSESYETVSVRTIVNLMEVLADVISEHLNLFAPDLKDDICKLEELLIRIRRKIKDTL